MNTDDVAEEIEAALTKLGTNERAVESKRYLKSKLRFLGVTVPVVRREARRFVKEHPDLGRGPLRALMTRLFEREVSDLRSFGIAVAELSLPVLRKADASWLIDLVRACDTWAHVDWLAVKVLGGLVAREPELRASLDRWARDENFWVRRAALLSLHDPILAGKGDFDHFAKLAIPMLHEREFFIRKAIGWVLRSAVRRGPERTVAFVKQHAREMSGLTFREAVRNLPERDQRRLEAVRVGA